MNPGPGDIMKLAVQTSLRLLAFPAAALAGCAYNWTLPGTGGAGGAGGSTTSASSSSSSTSSSTSSSSTMSSASSSSGVPGGCPGSVPAADAPCGEGVTDCYYGTDPRPECRAHWQCKGGTWAEVPSATAACDTKLEACKVAAGGVCSGAGAVCVQPDGHICLCVSDGAPQDHLQCDDPGDNCPLPFPNIGEACQSDETCDYGLCSAGIRVQRKCEKGVWVDQPIAC